MDKREKVIKGLMVCQAQYSSHYCSQCHYPIDPSSCIRILPREAFDLLKADAPRVMTLEEARKLRADDVVWLEDKDKQKVIPAIFRNRHLWPHSAVMVLNFMRGDGVKVTAGEDDYGERWRCWTSRPTDEQRAATPWEAVTS